MSLFVSDIDLIIKLEDNIQDKGNLFLGSVYGADRIKMRNNEKIFTVLSIGGEPQCQVRFDRNNFTHQTLNAFDHPKFNISALFDHGVEFIKQQLKTSNVLVHCFAGASRSSSIIIAYLMKVHKMSLNDALALAKSKRAIVNPNPGFLEQLKQYEQKLNKERK